MKTTVGEIRAALHGLPDDLPVRFEPITQAWLGTMNPMRFENTSFFNAGTGARAQPGDEGAEMSVYLHEDD